MNPKEIWKVARTRANLESALGATALQNLRWHGRQEARRIKAEDEAAHKAMWGKEMSGADDMGDVILGDNATYVTRSGGMADALTRVAMMAAVTVPLTYLGSQWIDRPAPDPPPVIEGKDTDSRIGLRIVRE